MTMAGGPNDGLAAALDGMGDVEEVAPSLEDVFIDLVSAQ